MTTPVMTTAGQKSKPGKLAFVMENRMGTDPQRLPVPRDSRFGNFAVQISAVGVLLLLNATTSCPSPCNSKQLLESTIVVSYVCGFAASAGCNWQLRGRK